MQEMVRFYAYCRIKQHASLRLLWDRLIFLFSLLQVYSQGGMVNILTSTLKLTSIYHSSLTVRSTRVSNPISDPNLRVSASIITWKTAFAASIPLSIYRYQPSSKYDINLYLILALFITFNKIED